MSDTQPEATVADFEVLPVSGDDEDPGYSVFYPSPPGCVSKGDD